MQLSQQKNWYRESLPLRGAVIIDVGANVGELSELFFKQCGPKGRVVSVEPHPANIKALQKRIHKAGSKRWKLKRCAASDHQGTVSLRRLDTGSGHNAMIADRGDFTAPCLPLSQLEPDATVVKLDIEGHEYVVMRDAVDKMTKVRAWAVELHKVDGFPLEDTLQRFTEAGFTLASAGQKRDDPSRWLSVPIDATLTWDGVPGQRSKTGRLFKMLHVIASR